MAGNYAFSDSASLRASAGTGFRAPTPGQISTTNVSTRINDAGVPVAEGIFPATHPVSKFFGAEPLDAEDSTQVSFFNNDLDTQTQGVDLVATYAIDSGAGLTEFSASLNRNRTRVTEIPTRTGRDGSPFSFVNEEAVFDTENALPKTQGVFTLRHRWERFDVMGRAHWYADYRHANSANFADPENIQQFDGKILFDLQAAWRIGDTYTLTLGGQNVFGETPDRARFEACCGRIYRSDSMVPWQGAYYHLRLAAGT